MTKYVTKTNRTFKSEQHALMTAAIALLKYSTDGYHCDCQNLPSKHYERHDYARFEVDIFHGYGGIIEICDYLTPTSIETRHWEADGSRAAYGCTTLVYEYEG